MTLTEKEKKTLKHVLNEEIDELEKLMDECVNEDDYKDLCDSQHTLESILAKIDD